MIRVPGIPRRSKESGGVREKTFGSEEMVFFPTTYWVSAPSCAGSLRRDRAGVPGEPHHPPPGRR
jgi:hypothetical protein